MLLTVETPYKKIVKNVLLQKTSSYEQLHFFKTISCQTNCHIQGLVLAATIELIRERINILHINKTLTNPNQCCGVNSSICLPLW